MHAIQAQVAAGSINNYVTFNALLDRAQEALDEVDGVDEEAREEPAASSAAARASGTIATGTASGAGRAVVGALL